MMRQCILVHGHNDGYRQLHCAGVLPTEKPCPDISAQADSEVGATGYFVELTSDGAWISIGQVRRDPKAEMSTGFIIFSIFVHNGTFLPRIKEALDRVLATYDLLTGQTGNVDIPEQWDFVDHLSAVLEEQDVPETQIWIPSERRATAKMYVAAAEIEPFLQETSLPRYALYQRVFIVPKELYGTKHDPLIAVFGEQLDTTPDISQEMAFELRERHRSTLSSPTEQQDSDTENVTVIFTFGKSRYVSPGRTEFICQNPELMYNEVTQVISYPKKTDAKGTRFMFKFAETYQPCEGILTGEEAIELELHYSKRGKFTYYKPLLIGIAALLVIILAILLWKSIDLPKQPKVKIQPTSSVVIVQDDSVHPINADDNPGPNDSVGWAIKFAEDYLATDEWLEDSLQHFYNALNHYAKLELLDAGQTNVKDKLYVNLLFRHAINQNMQTKGTNCMEDLANLEKFPQIASQLGEEKYQLLNDILARPDLQRRITRNRGELIKSSYPRMREIIYGKQNKGQR